MSSELADELVLWPNVGAEQGRSYRHPQARPRVRAIAWAWRLLFGSSARVLRAGREPDWPPWIRRGAGRSLLAAGPERGGVPWLATLEAARSLAERGVELTGCDPSVVHRVHDKAFALTEAERLGCVPEPLRDRVHTFDQAEMSDDRTALERLCAAVEGWPGWARGRWVMKPRHGASGRGHLRGGPGDWEASIGRAAARARGGVVLEPWLERTADLSVQLEVGDSDVAVLGTTVQRLDRHFGWDGNQGCRDRLGEIRSGTEYDRPLIAAGLEIGHAARRAGFRGVCGLDALSFRTPDGSEWLRPVVELNARYTMGSVAIAAVRRAAQQDELQALPHWWCGWLPRGAPAIAPIGEATADAWVGPLTATASMEPDRRGPALVLVLASSAEACAEGVRAIERAAGRES